MTDAYWPSDKRTEVVAVPVACHYTTWRRTPKSLAVHRASVWLVNGKSGRVLRSSARRAILLDHQSRAALCEPASRTLEVSYDQ